MYRKVSVPAALPASAVVNAKLVSAVRAERYSADDPAINVAAAAFVGVMNIMLVAFVFVSVTVVVAAFAAVNVP